MSDNTQYNTRDLNKATKLFTALVMAGFQTQMLSCIGHVHIVTAASTDEFAAIRATIGVPSSIDVAVASVVIPDDISSI